MSIYKFIISKIRHLTKRNVAVIDIYSKKSGVAGRLSNFTKRRFIFDGVLCNSIEGFLQSLKFQDKEKQKEICTFDGIEAKRAGANQEWAKTQTLYWNGIPYQRDSMEYQGLLDRFYISVYDQDKKFVHDLGKTRRYVLTHSMGSNDSKGTVLTENEFCSRLMLLRDVHRSCPKT